MTIQKSRFSSEAAPQPAGSQDEAGLAGMMDSIHRTASTFRRLPNFAIGLSEDARDGTMLAAGPTNPGSTTSESGHPQPTISGFFVPAIWATTPGKRTNEHNTHAERGGSVPAFAVWSRGPNKPARVNKARPLSGVVDAMPHLICSMADSLNREIKAMIYTFLIPHSRTCRLADLRRIRIISAFANNEAQARAALAGLPLVFVSRRPSGEVAA